MKKIVFSKNENIEVLNHKQYHQDNDGELWWESNTVYWINPAAPLSWGKGREQKLFTEVVNHIDKTITYFLGNSSPNASELSIDKKIAEMLLQKITG